MYKEWKEKEKRERSENEEVHDAPPHSQPFSLEGEVRVEMEFADMLPILAMVIVQVGYSGMTIISKVALNDGFNPFVFVTYRQLFSTMATLPFALFLER